MRGVSLRHAGSCAESGSRRVPTLLRGTCQTIVPVFLGFPKRPLARVHRIATFLLPPLRTAPRLRDEFVDFA